MDGAVESPDRKMATGDTGPVSYTHLEDEGYAIGYVYNIIDDKPVFEADPAYIGAAPNFMAGLKDAEDYADDEIDEKYLDDEFDEEEEAEEED